MEAKLDQGNDDDTQFKLGRKKRDKRDEMFHYIPVYFGLLPETLSITLNDAVDSFKPTDDSVANGPSASDSAKLQETGKIARSEGKFLRIFY